MELASPHWSFDGLSDELDPTHLTNLRLDLYGSDRLHALRSGLWWVYPLGRTYTSRLIGLRLRPGTPLSHSPVVMADEGVAVTLCSRPAALIPTLLFEHMAVPAGWDEVADMSEEEWTSTIEVHRALGGEDDLSTLRTILANRALAAAIHSDYPRGVRAQAEGRIQLDPTPETAIRWRYAAEAATARHTNTTPPEAGCWNASLATLAFQGCRDETPTTHDLELEAAWRMLQGSPSLDGARFSTEMAGRPSCYDAVRLGVAAAHVVTERLRPEWSADPRVPAIQALASDNRDDDHITDYNGAAHLDATTALAQAGDTGGAFDALMAAAFWSYQATGEAQPEALDAAITLARHADANDIADFLERQRSLHKELLKGLAEQGELWLACCRVTMR